MSGDRYKLSDDGMTLRIARRVPGGVRTATYRRQRDAGPFTDEDVATALALTPSASGWQVGQRNRTRRYETRYGTLYAHLMLGPPTWWVPKLPWKRNGAIMAGWLRLAVAVWFEWPAPPVAAALDLDSEPAPVLRDMQGDSR